MKYVPIVDYLERFYILTSGERIVLQPHQKRILNLAFTPDSGGKLPYKTIVYSTIKKSGKTQIGAAIANWWLFGAGDIREPYNEAYCFSNDLEGSIGRHFRALKASIEVNPLFKKKCRILDRLIELEDGTMVQPISGDYAGIAGCNPGLTLFDEIWGIFSEKSRRLFEELTPVVTRKNSTRLITTYAGFSGQSDLLEDIYQRVVRPENKIDDELPLYASGDNFAYWDSGTEARRMPWQKGPAGDAYYESELVQPGFRMSAYRRLHLNEWTAGEEGFEIKDWDKCVENAEAIGYQMPGLMPTPEIPIAIGIDASLKKDRSAIVSVYKKEGKLWLGPRMFWEPTPDNPIIFEDTLIRYIRALAKNYFIAIAYYDPWQFEAVAQVLSREGIPLEPYHQTLPAGIAMTEHLIDCLRENTFVPYRDDELRKELMMVTLKEEMGKGRRMVKDAKTKKIDSAVALAMAALAAAKNLPDYRSLGDQIMPLRLRRR